MGCFLQNYFNFNIETGQAISFLASSNFDTFVKSNDSLWETLSCDLYDYCFSLLGKNDLWKLSFKFHSYFHQSSPIFFEFPAFVTL